jgi:hypothetical protein
MVLARLQKWFVDKNGVIPPAVRGAAGEWTAN